MSEKVDPAVGKIDYGYGDTPEEALRCVLERQPAFASDAEYLTSRPEFMDVKADEFDLHDWNQYKQPRDDEEEYFVSTLGPEDGPRVNFRRVRDTPDDQDDRYRLQIQNVWLNVASSDENRGRFDVDFSFSLPLRESWLEEPEDGSVRVRHPRGSEIVWMCERRSTE